MGWIITELAQNHHEKLQCMDPHKSQNPEERIRTLEAVLREIPESQYLPEPNLSPLNWKVQENHVKRALDLAKDGIAAGLDGCPNELWKKLNQHYKTAQKANKQGFNIIKALTILFHDI